MDPKSQAATAVKLLTPLVEGTQDDQLQNATPCSEWNVRDLLNHVIGGGHMFAAGLRGEQFEGGAGPVDLVGDDHRASWAAISESFSTALAGADDLDQMVSLPFGTMPAAVALQLAAGDLLVHSWDLARATGQSFDPPVEFVEPSYEFFKMVVNDDLRAAGMFGPALDAADGADPLAKLLAHAGRHV